jgi:hypothetical protein
MSFVIEVEGKHVASEEYKNFVIMNKSNHSYAINRKISDVLSSNSWAGRRCFIIGGGESMKGFDFSQLDKELTIGINKSFEVYSNATINYSMDSTFYDSMKKGDYDKMSGESLWDKWLSFKGLRVFLTPMEIKEFGREVYLVKRLFDFTVSRDLQNGIHGGRNSGFGAIMLAVALGASTIYLLGYDMKAKVSSHWHSGYPDRDLAEFNQKLSEYRQEIQSALPWISKLGIDVVNLTPDSELKCFDSNLIDKVLKN